jgi:hypothetical protein
VREGEAAQMVIKIDEHTMMMEYDEEEVEYKTAHAVSVEVLKAHTAYNNEMAPCLVNNNKLKAAACLIKSLPNIVTMAY